MKEAMVHGGVVQLAKRAAVRIGKNGFRAELFGYGRQFIRDEFDGFVPGDAFERRRSASSRTFGNIRATLHRIKQSIGRIDAVQILRDLGAEEAARHGMPRVALDLYGLAVVNG